MEKDITSKPNTSLQRRFAVSLILNALLIIIGIIGIIIAASMKGAALFMMYTNLSNILAIISSLVYLIFGIHAWKSKSIKVPKAVSVFRFFASVSLMVTFSVVLIGFLTGIGVESFSFAFIDDSALPLHLVCPILSLLTFLIFEQPEKLRLKYIFIASLLTYAYSVVSVTLNILKIWHGPYPFLYVYEQTIFMSIFWIVVINGGTMIIALVLLLIKNHQAKLRSI